MESRKSTRFLPTSQKARAAMAFGFCVILAAGFYYAQPIPSTELVPLPQGEIPTIVPSLTESTVTESVLEDHSVTDVPSPTHAALVSSGTPRGLSVAETLTGLNRSEVQNRLDDFVSLGITWVRLDFDWAVIQRQSPEVYDWSRIDMVVEEARKRNLKLLPILAYTPRWARSENCTVRCPPEDPATFARFAGEAAKRYAPHDIHTWEIWNEPNAAPFWRGGADPVAYAALLKAAYLNIKNVDPDADIILGGLATVPTRNGSMAPREYLSALYEQGAGAYFTAVGFHPYTFPVTATYDAPWNAWQQMSNTNPSLRDIMIAHGDRQKQIWITEYGAPTGGPGAASSDYIPGQSSDHVTEERQKEMLVDALSDIEKHSWLGPFFWYSYRDLGTSRETTENFYGLIRADGSHKPAYDALKERASN